MVEATSTEIQVLLDKDAIKELLYKFDYDSDDGDPVGAIARYCTEDVRFDGGPLGTAEGMEDFQELTKTIFSEHVLFTRHMLHNPIIDVDGDEASGKWYADIPAITGDGKAVWMQVTYEVGFRRVEDEWKISSYKPNITYATPYEKGWVKQPFIEDIPGNLDW